MIKKITFLIFVTSLLFLSSFAQVRKKPEITEKQEAKLIESGPYQTSEMASLLIDMLRNEMQKNLNIKGLIIVYCGKNCQYGEIEAHLRGINVSL